jgi:hypothetical protein
MGFSPVIKSLLPLSFTHPVLRVMADGKTAVHRRSGSLNGRGAHIGCGEFTPNGDSQVIASVGT